MIRPVFSTDLDATIGVNEIPKTTEFVVFPNPTNGLLNLRLNGQEYYGEYQLMNSIGQVFQTGMDSSINLFDVSPGLYYLTLPKLSTEVYKIIKQ